MNTKKMSNLIRMIALFLTAVILICTFGFTVDGWAAKDDEPTQDTPPQNDEIPDKDTTEIPEEPEIVLPQYINRLTGLETTEDLENKSPIAFIMENDAPCYGLSEADIIVEIPTENGSRLVCIRTDNDSLWKIGSVAPTRGYISNIAKFFGTIPLSMGSDDVMSYESCYVGDYHYDLSTITGYHYTEYNDFVYTNSDLIKGLLKDNESSSEIPYSFAEFGSEVSFEDVATRVSLGGKTELILDEETRRYTWYENGEAKRDLINGKTVDFANCLVLFADSVIYDNSNGYQMVMNTVGSGEGYYITKGSVTMIKWSATTGGIMTIYSSNGERLVVNRGETYIKYIKTSQADNIVFN